MEIKTTSESVKSETQIINLLKSKRKYFWDKGPLKPQQDKYIIIERILEFGSEDEVNIILKYYDNAYIKDIIRNSRALSQRTVNYFALLLGISREETKCFSDASQKIWQPF